MTWVTAAVIGGGALIGGYASMHAGQQQADAANRATDQQAAMFNTINQQNAPYRQAGYNSLNTIGANQNYFNHAFNAQDLNANLAPNYQFMLDQGRGQTSNAANVTGGLVSGNALQGLDQFTQNYAQNAYQQAYNNYTNNQNNIYNRLASTAGLGQAANQTSAGAGMSLGNGMAQSMMGAGNAQAAGTMGMGNAISSGLNNYAMYNYLNHGSGGGSAVMPSGSDFNY